MSADEQDASAPSHLPGLFNRRQLMRGLLATGMLAPAQAQPGGAQAHGNGSGAAVRLGVLQTPDVGSEDLAYRVARHLKRQLDEPVTLTTVHIDTDLMQWCQSEPRVSSLLLCTAWRLGTAPSWHSPHPALAGFLAGRQPLALLRSEPLALAVNRFQPRSLLPALDKAYAGAAGIRYATDATDGMSRQIIERWLSGPRWASMQHVPFRGQAQLLPALSGARVEMTVQPLGSVSASDTGRWLAAHRARDISVVAVADVQRLPGLPDVPTLDEALSQAGHRAVRCHVLLAAPDLAASRLHRLSVATAALVAGPGSSLITSP